MIKLIKNHWCAIISGIFNGCYAIHYIYIYTNQYQTWCEYMKIRQFKIFEFTKISHINVVVVIGDYLLL